MRTLITGVALTLLLSSPADAAKSCTAPGWDQYITGAVQFSTGGPDTRFVNQPVPYPPGAVFAAAIDEDGATDATISAEVVGRRRESPGYVVAIALKSRLVDEPGYAEFLRALVCVRRW